MKYLVLSGRLFYSLIFLLSSFNHFSTSTIEYAASKGVPMASILVPAAGIIAFAGSLSIILGYKAKLGAWLIVVFLIPVTLMMHNFWALTDATMREMQQINFMKNLSMLGGAFIIAYFGAGPISIDSRAIHEREHT
jgi:putative oxidoreductase